MAKPAQLPETWLYTTTLQFHPNTQPAYSSNRNKKASRLVLYLRARADQACAQRDWLLQCVVERGDPGTAISWLDKVAVCLRPGPWLTELQHAITLRFCLSFPVPKGRGWDEGHERKTGEQARGERRGGEGGCVCSPG
ncbi:hypothetical protein DPEC_G00294240 [Dallia pectoralis]|uniref:Uncharacterized protein n=1 Tax=Dallia pectoralis TaxID=75939 RepID=A0ACC2FIF1_DALPE|nr:hypothetical protein DPEC_G00294240 [Dallia pectoralis]